MNRLTYYFIFSETECDTIRHRCCSYNSNYGMIPYRTWGTTPPNEKTWHTENNCNSVMGGSILTNCPYECGMSTEN